MSFVSKEIRRFGYIVVNDVQVLAAQYHFECDSASDLPTQAQFQNDKNVFLFMGSTAHTIDADALYKMDSSGAWVQQSQPWQPLTDYSVLSNKPQINGHTLTGNQSGADFGLQNALTFDNTPTQDSTNPVTSGGIWTDQQRQDTLQDEDRAALVEIVDVGAKNHCTLASGSNAPPARWINIPVSDVGAGQWIMSFGTLTSTDTDDAFCQAICFNSSDQQVSNWANFKRESNTYKIFSTTDSVSYVRLYPANSYATSDGDTVAFTNAMMCSKAAWEISRSFQPYRPSWQQMYDMILALQ